jgi:hypothetical protein
MSPMTHDPSAPSDGAPPHMNGVEIVGTAPYPSGSADPDPLRQVALCNGWSERLAGRELRESSGYFLRP